MKQITKLITGLFLMLISFNAIAFPQELDKQACTVEYNLFKGDVTAKNFKEAKVRLLNLLENCPTLSVNIYKFGYKIVDNMIAQGQKVEGMKFMNTLVDQRLLHFADDAGKVYNDFASFLSENDISREQIFQVLDKAYKANPEDISPKNIFLFFEVILERNKEINAQKILDTYDEILDIQDNKTGEYQKRLSALIAKEEGGETLSRKEARSKRVAAGRLNNIGIVVSGLENRIEEFLTCDRIIPLYRRDFGANRNNATWLRRAVSKMNAKECTEDALYEELAEAYAAADPSSNSYIFLSGILERKGKTEEALAMRKKAIELEVDPIRKARYLLQIGADEAKKKRYSSARKYATDAIASNPSYGKAYILISSLYASSANSCGDNEFAKRMVYVAALNKAERAVAVDPSIGSSARKYIKSYKSNIPTKAMGFADGIKDGDSFKVGCWIGETVKVRLR
jgi:tetratricopeptide (TPR) repeat protein